MRPGSWWGRAVLGFGLALLGVRALHSFRNFQLRSRRAEVMVELREAYQKLQAQHAAPGRYDPDVTRNGFHPERGNRFAYYLAASGPVQLRPLCCEESKDPAVIVGMEDKRERGAFPQLSTNNSFAATGCPVTPARTPSGELVSVGVHGAPPKDLFVLAAAGDLDEEDDDLDCWSIASVERRAASGETIPAGLPYLELSDLRSDSTLARLLYGEGD